MVIPSAIIIVPQEIELKNVVTVHGRLKIRLLDNYYIADSRFKCYLVSVIQTSLLIELDKSIVAIDVSDIKEVSRIHDNTYDWKFVVNETENYIPRLNIIDSVEEEFFGVKKGDVSIIWFILTKEANERFISYFLFFNKF